MVSNLSFEASSRPPEGLLTSTLLPLVAALLGVTQVNSYEGEAAMKVEALAARYLRHHTHYQPEHFKVDYSFESYLRAIEEGIGEGRSIGELALNFIATIAYQLVSFALKSAFAAIPLIPATRPKLK